MSTETNPKEGASEYRIYVSVEKFKGTLDALPSVSLKHLQVEKAVRN